MYFLIPLSPKCLHRPSFSNVYLSSTNSPNPKAIYLLQINKKFPSQNALAKVKCDFSFFFPFLPLYLTFLFFPLLYSSSLFPFAYTSDHNYSPSLPEQFVTVGMDIMIVLIQSSPYLKVFNHLQAELHAHYTGQFNKRFPLRLTRDCGTSWLKMNLSQCLIL